MILESKFMRILLWLAFFSFECFGATKFVDLNTGYTLNINQKAGEIKKRNKEDTHPNVCIFYILH
ncbi:hypothetical protein ATS75_04525 [Pseudoalteromonas sp. H105]|nr:hypothetical protein ATS75_04525 [Pseudoalteromonas sp. H105]